MSDYLPLYAERRCVICGFYRSQHRVDGDAANDSAMYCPLTFVADGEHGRQLAATRIIPSRLT